MPFTRNLIYQSLISCLFFMIFFTSSLYIDEFIEGVNIQKSLYPILVYSNTQKEINEIRDFTSDFNIVKKISIINPDSLETYIIEKYKLDTYSEIASGYKLPYQMEIYFNPVDLSQIKLFFISLSETFPDKIIHKNEEMWYDIENRVSILNFNKYILQAIALLSFIILMLFYRMLFINNQRESINAILASGISTDKFKRRILTMSFLFIIITGIFFILFNLVYNFYYSLHQQLHYKLIMAMILSNILVLIFQKKLKIKK